MALEKRLILGQVVIVLSCALSAEVLSALKNVAMPKGQSTRESSQCLKPQQSQ